MAQRAYSIAFIGYNREQTIFNYNTFIFANKDFVKYHNNFFAEFNDGTILFPVYSVKECCNRVYDYIIVSDDWRMHALNSELLYQLKGRLSNIVPEEFSIIKDNIDEGLKECLL